jgi:hypothetical protein
MRSAQCDTGAARAKNEKACGNGIARLIISSVGADEARSRIWLLQANHWLELFIGELQAIVAVQWHAETPGRFLLGGIPVQA